VLARDSQLCDVRYASFDQSSCPVNHTLFVELMYSYMDEKYVYGIYSILYLVVALVALLQISRLVWYTKRKCQFDLMAGMYLRTKQLLLL
jgi:hypothetical protein